MRRFTENPEEWDNKIWKSWMRWTHKLRYESYKERTCPYSPMVRVNIAICKAMLGRDEGTQSEIDFLIKHEQYEFLSSINIQ